MASAATPFLVGARTGWYLPPWYLTARAWTRWARADSKVARVRDSRLSVPENSTRSLEPETLEPEKPDPSTTLDVGDLTVPARLRFWDSCARPVSVAELPVRFRS